MTERHGRVRRLAFALYERRLAAVVDGDPFQTAMVRRTPPHELQQRDWLLAEGLDDQGHTMEVFKRPRYSAVEIG